MINFIIAYDNQDANLGQYFGDCKNQLLEVLREQDGLVNGEVYEIFGNKCNNAYIDMLIPQYQPNPFIFVAYSHGNERALCCGNNNYVEKDVNAHHFVNSLFYTTACSVGKELGAHLVENGCLAFVGYDDTVSAYRLTEKKDISEKCDNAGIIEFLSADITIWEAYMRMRNYYTLQINKFENLEDMIFAGDLVEARDALVCLGDKNLKKEDLFILKNGYIL
jgi:hypothetical protein